MCERGFGAGVVVECSQAADDDTPFLVVQQPAVVVLLEEQAAQSMSPRAAEALALARALGDAARFCGALSCGPVGPGR